MRSPELRVILRAAVEYYGSEPEHDSLRESVYSIKESLPAPQRLAVLDDLIHIAGADGEVNDNEKELIASLARSLDVGVNLAPAE